MYAITGAYRSFGGGRSYPVGRWIVYYNASAFQIADADQGDIYDMLCFDGEILLLRPETDAKFLVFLYTGRVYYYCIEEKRLVQAALDFLDPDVHVHPFNGEVLVLA